MVKQEERSNSMSNGEEDGECVGRGVEGRKSVPVGT